MTNFNDNSRATNDEISAFGSPAAIYGRSAELDRLTAQLHETLSGAGGAVTLICGEPGIGKTRLAEELILSGKKMGMRSLWGRCVEDTAAPPFWPWEQALRDVAKEDERLVFTLPARSSKNDNSEFRFSGSTSFGEATEEIASAGKIRFFDRVSCALRELADSAPLLLTIDDLQWADDPTLGLLEYAARELAAAPVMVVITLRPQPTSPALTETIASISSLPRYDRIDLYGLDISNTSQLIETISGRRLVDKDRHSVYELTNGLPLFARQLGLAFRDRSVSLDAPTSYTRTLRDLVAKRLARTGQECVELLRAASLIGRRFRLRTVAAVTGVKPERALDALSIARDGVLVAPTGSPGEFEFVHDLVRETVRESLPQLERMKLHAEIGRRLEEEYGMNSGEHAIELFNHFSRAQMLTGTEPIIRYAPQAGETALQSYAFEDARKILEAALACLDSSPMDDAKAEILWGLIRARRPTTPSHILIDEIADVVNHYERTGQYGKAREILLQRKMVEPKLSPLLTRALRHADKGTGEFARLLLIKTMIDGTFNLDPDVSYRKVERALEMARSSSDRKILLDCLLRASYAPWVFGRPEEENTAIWEEARKLAQELGDIPREISITIYLAIAANSTGEQTRLERYAKEAFTLAEQCNDPIAQEDCFLLQLGIYYNECKYEEAVTHLRERLQRNLQRDRASGHWQAHLVEALLVLGRFTEAEKELGILVEQARKIPDSPNDIFHITAETILTFCEQTGSVYALDFAETIITRLIRRQDVNRRWAIRGELTLGLIHTAVGNSGRAKQHYDAVTTYAESLPDNDSLKNSLRGDIGKLAYELGDFDSAVDSFRFFVERPHPHGRFSGSCDLAKALLARNGADDIAEAKMILDEVRPQAEALGLITLHSRVTRVLESIQVGADTPADGTATADAEKSAYVVSGPSLTPREREVLALIANGYTNREIGEILGIKNRTVDSHVARILEKTGAANRAEAAVLASETGLLGGGDE